MADTTGWRTAAATRKAELDRLRARAPAGLRNFERSQDIELTFTSNAIEGNTLTAAETTLVIEHGITVGGKPLRDHLEAIDNFEALRYVRGLARQETRLTEMDVRSLHRLVMLRSAPDIAGRYADQGRYVVTDSGRHAFPSPAEVPAPMGAFAEWLGGLSGSPDDAFTAHLRFVNIHPFNDGNGRTARLLMNLVLLRAGYPPVAIRPLDRTAYLSALEAMQAGEGPGSYERLMFGRLLAALDEAVAAASQAIPEPS